MNLATQKKSSKQQVIYHQQLEHAFPGGLAKEFAAWDAKAKAAAAQLAKKDAFTCFRHLDGAKQLKELREKAANITKRFTDLVLIGTGGSSLGAKALSAVTQQPAIRMHFLENVDPDTAEAMLQRLNPDKTFVLIVSKSGNTMEVMTHALIWIDHFKAETSDYARHFLILTQESASPLREVAERHGIETLAHDDKIGGRYSIFSNVGLLPAACLGLDVSEFCGAAKDVLEDFQQRGSASAPAAGAATQAAWLAGKLPLQVFMPYGDPLQTLGYWYRQLTAESLGKNGKGFTPLTALGTVDQHSMLQLFLDGPRDKAFTLILSQQQGRGAKVDKKAVPEAMGYIGNKTIGDMLQASQYGAVQTLIRKELPFRTFEVEQLDAATMGALMAHFIIETVMTAALLEINPYDQPAVEEGKINARRYLEEGGL